MDVKEKRFPTWGELTLSTLVLSFVTGIVLLFKYELSAPYNSVSLIDSVYCCGSFLRNLHYFSSAFSLVFLAMHGWKYLLDRYFVKVDAVYWLVSLFLFYTVVFEAFSGYVIRFDQEGFFAGRIASQIVATIPVVGKTLADFLFQSSRPVTFFVFHVIFLPVLLLIFLYNHIRWTRYVDVEKFFWANLIPFLLSIFVHAPLPPPHFIESDPIKGPWFFLGMQELVYIFPPFVGGVIIPLIFFLLWLLYPFVEEKYRRWIKVILLVMIFTYVVLDIEAFFFRGPGWRLEF